MSVYKGPLKCESQSWDSDIFWPVQWHFSVNTSDDILLNLKTQCQIKQSLCCMWPFDEKKKKKISTSIFVCATLRTWPLKNVCTSKVSESFRNRSRRITLSKLTRNVKPAQYHNFQWHLGPERYKFGHASDDMARHERLFHGSEMYWLAFIYRVNVWEKKG